MKILIICQYYKPEPFRISDICEGLVARGHDVTVVTGTPNYPEGEIYPEYSGRDLNGHENEMICGVKIHRCKIIPRKTGAMYRLLNYLSFSHQSKKYIRTLTEEFDVVFVNQLSPIMMANAGIEYKKLHATKLVIYSQDLWPESLCVGGVKKGGFIYRMFHQISNRIYNQANEILVTSKGFEQYLVSEFNIDKNTINYLPQYAEDTFDITEKRADDQNINLVFAGNIGVAQNVDSIILVAKKIENKNIVFHIVGSGTELENCKELAEKNKLENVIFHGRKPLSEMPFFYSKADAMLITLVADEFLSRTIPGKLQSYMFAGKPIIGAINGETQNIIKEAKCGFCCNVENIEEFACNIEKFAQLTSENRTMLAQNSRKFYDLHFSKDIFLSELEKVLTRNGL